jgi:hypothetical protein
VGDGIAVALGSTAGSTKASAAYGLECFGGLSGHGEFILLLAPLPSHSGIFPLRCARLKRIERQSKSHSHGLTSHSFNLHLTSTLSSARSDSNRIFPGFPSHRTFSTNSYSAPTYLSITYTKWPSLTLPVRSARFLPSLRWADEHTGYAITDPKEFTVSRLIYASFLHVLT